MHYTLAITKHYPGGRTVDGVQLAPLPPFTSHHLVSGDWAADAADRIARLRRYSPSRVLTIDTGLMWLAVSWSEYRPELGEVESTTLEYIGTGAAAPMFRQEVAR
jgi:hypothetical protein